MIEVPNRMQHLERDHRGYPIPFVVLRDNEGTPHFTINDEHKVMRCRKNDLCPICGRELLRGRWFLGGPMSALHPRGAYIDPPLHHECMRFAVQTCPYLINAKYTKRIDDKKLDRSKIPDTMILVDPTLDPTRPKIFIAAMAVGQTYTEDGYVVPKHPYRGLEFWRDGKMEQKFERNQIPIAMKIAFDRFKSAGMLQMGPDDWSNLPTG
jgi:hypothetical protein